jgi:hypothetical protein
MRFELGAESRLQLPASCATPEPLAAVAAGQLMTHSARLIALRGQPKIERATTPRLVGISFKRDLDRLCRQMPRRQPVHRRNYRPGTPPRRAQCWVRRRLHALASTDRDGVSGECRG